MKKTWIKISSIFFMILTVISVFCLGIQKQEAREELKEAGMDKTVQIVKSMVMELLPQYGYQDQSNMEMLYSFVKKAISQEMIPLLGYLEDYGVNSQELISENPVPAFLYSENDETGETKETSGDQVTSFTPKQLYNRSFLRKYFIQVDSTTTITDQELNGKELFGKDLTLNNSKSPQILIFHTHGSESYADSESGKQSDTVVGVGEQLKKELEKQGFSVYHDKTSYDIKNGQLDRSKAYYYAAQGIEALLKKYPQIQVVIDLHRDGVASGTRLVTKVDGKKTAQIMFFNGMSRTATNGEISYLKNPNKLWNLAFSMQLQKKAYEKYPGFTRKVYVKGYRYNLHYRKRSLLVEVGAQTNTVEEAYNAMKPLANLLSSVLK
ncbi:MAG: stage II sporulation protein P [Lachnospiraceae bacterium]|nr:stage II sporulation protein P [Lachnospiraceae bacterium]